MSIEVDVFFRGTLPNKTALSRALVELGFPLTISAGSLERQDGFMPMRLRREDTGVEFQIYNDRARIEEIAGEAFDPSFERCANFRWGGDKYQMLCGLCASAALAKLVGGLVLDGESGELLRPDQAIAQARRAFETFRKSRDPRQGTRPADLKRYLQPLLKQRSELVLIGRMLVVRPVRHILRGAFFDGRDNYILIYPIIKLLCRSLGATDYRGRPHKAALTLWQPHFEPFLMDTLAEDVFEDVGKITSLEDFAAAPPTEAWFPMARVPALHLAGEPDRAAAEVECIAGHDNQYWKPWWESQRDLLAMDIGEVCAMYRTQEAKEVKALKLERIWEPSPFPAELPGDRRKQQSDEPLFSTNPWPQRPEWLLANLSDEVGDVRFAKQDLRRNGQPILLVPLSREQAEERHRNWERYALGVRISDKLLLVLCRSGRDRLDPDPIGSSLDPARASDLHLVFDALNFSVRARVERDREVEDPWYLRSLDVVRRDARWSTWQWSFTPDEGLKRTWDYRSGEQVYTEAAVTDGERDRFTLPQINFGEFEPLVQIVLRALRSEGFGEIT
ncbi:MAG: hypothetical protein JO000_15615 [Alphaproteobacteria bacterium]|nr:hypothetical protein [Alphaproteobacteria bacterium]